MNLWPPSHDGENLSLYQGSPSQTSKIKKRTRKSKLKGNSQVKVIRGIKTFLWVDKALQAGNPFSTIKPFPLVAFQVPSRMNYSNDQ